MVKKNKKNKNIGSYVIYVQTNIYLNICECYMNKYFFFHLFKLML